MLQAVMITPGRIEFREIPIPEPGVGEVLVRILRIGVCGSDIHVYHGKHPYTTYPVVQGHEVSGSIERVGPGVKSLQPGDKVTLQPQVVCGHCLACTQGRYNICENLKVMGFQTTGTASEFFVVNAAKVLKLPDGLGYDEGALVEPLAVAVHALARGGHILGKKILVLGAGPIGNLVAQAAKGMGAEAVMITDPSVYRLSKARECGIDFCVDPTRQDLMLALLEHFGPDRADLVLECAGSGGVAIEQAIACARNGTDIIIVGVFGDRPPLDLARVQDRELRLVGTLMYQERDYVKAIQLIETRKVSIPPLITDRFDFKDYQAAYEWIDMKRDQVMKVLVVVEAANPSKKDARKLGEPD